ncbi:MAG: AIR synthase related protein [Saccharospirillaceae bacterium]|nr:AIR synthase related protein [Saccharospirillaceae bacterium]MCD8531845.1 AIR synthase related protein [Saccharospirillaceae bacterium]
MAKMSEIGEKEFIRKLIPCLNVDGSFVNGFGHDASIVDVGLEQMIACKIDRAPSPVALKRGIGTYKTWGRLAVVANVSDLLSVGAVPKSLMISLVLPREFDDMDAKDIVLGCQEACIEHGIAFIGGDTKEGKEVQVIGSAWGVVERNREFGRGTASPGDYLFLAGLLGGFSGAIELISQKTIATDVLRDCEDLIIRPKARVDDSRYLRQSGNVAFACDLSDGLVDALNVFCGDGVGITFNEADLPIHLLAKEASCLTGKPAWQYALGVGDWAIAFVVRESDFKKFKRAIPDDLEISEIGRFDDSGERYIQDRVGKKQRLPNLINEHFKHRAEDDGSYFDELLRS